MGREMLAWEPAMADFRTWSWYLETASIEWPTAACEQSIYEMVVHKLAVFVLSRGREQLSSLCPR
jgi:hypothetical protein